MNTRPLNVDEVHALAEKIVDRRSKLSDEDLMTSIMVVLVNAGDQFTPVRSIDDQWSGIKADLQVTDRGVPASPHGVPCTEAVSGRWTLGWVADESLVGAASPVESEAGRTVISEVDVHGVLARLAAKRLTALDNFDASRNNYDAGIAEGLLWAIEALKEKVRP